ncbi:MAG: hypothetical protein MR209_00070 [Veillonellaceae bacterium]|nr:hypothetical protein [Veillonellaceae bacterium]
MTITDICNLALSHLGVGTIRSVQDETETARACKLYYDATRRMLLREYPWGFARRLERLALMPDIRLPGYEYVYMYPELCLYIYKLTDGTPTPEERAQFEVLNLDNSTKVIATDMADAWVDYVYDVTDPDVWDTVFLEAMTRKLASDLCMRLVGNQGLFEQQFNLYRAALEVAVTQVARERQKDPEPLNRYRKARWR